MILAGTSASPKTGSVAKEKHFSAGVMWKTQECSV
jgi:hypothetical protein